MFEASIQFAHYPVFSFVKTDENEETVLKQKIVNQ